MAHFLIDMIKGYQVVVLVVPDQAIRGDSIPLAVPAKDLLARNVVVEIFEGDGLLRGQRPMEPVYIIIDALVHHLDPPADIDLALELPGLVDASQPL